MTLRKTLMGVLIALLVMAGYGATASAQDTDTTTESETDTDTTTDSDTDPDTASDTDTKSESETDGEITDDADGEVTDDAAYLADIATTSIIDKAAVQRGATHDTDNTTATGTSVAESFGTETPNPQPSQALTTTDGAAAGDGAASLTAEAAEAVAVQSADQPLAQNQLAFTGPDTRVMALAALLLGAGAVFLLASRAQKARLELAGARRE